jgi:hypothetical protein
MHFAIYGLVKHPMQVEHQVLAGNSYVYCHDFF